MREDRPSVTAVGVARAVAAAAEDPLAGPILPEGTAEVTRALLAEAGAARRLELRLSRTAPYRALVRAMERRGPLRGGMVHIALRKRYVADQVLAALRRGARHVVVAGAGLDALALRLAPAHPDVEFFELDHPATQSIKRRYLAKISPPRNVHLIGLDASRRDAGEAVRAHRSFGGGGTTAVVAEGVLMYLDPRSARAFLDGVARAFPGGTLVFSMVEARPDGAIEMGRAGWLLRPLLRLIREPFRFGLARPDLPEVLARHGLELIEHLDDRELLARYAPERSGAPRLDLEYVGAARIAGAR